MLVTFRLSNIGKPNAAHPTVPDKSVLASKFAKAFATIATDFSGTAEYILEKTLLFGISN